LRVRFLGEGKFGKVHLVVHKPTNMVFALKQIKKDSVAKNKME
jgi:serine/threonine protein kinase